MISNELYETYVSRVKEGCLYQEQGLVDWAFEVFTGILQDLERCELAAEEKEHLRTQVNAEMRKLPVISSSAQSPHIVMELPDEPQDEPPHCFTYGKALMDGQFWEEAIGEFDESARIQYRSLECWELCGDCASNLEDWQQASEYYRKVYLDDAVSEEIKKQVLVKMTRCSQSLKKIEVAASFQARFETSRSKVGLVVAPEPPSDRRECELAVATVDSLDRHVIQQLIGERIWSWKSERGEYVSRRKQGYRILNLLHVGISSLVVELEDVETGERFAGQSLASPFNHLITPEVLARWTPLADDGLFRARGRCVRPGSSRRQLLHRPGPLAPFPWPGSFRRARSCPFPWPSIFAHQILEGLGDLHLHMGRDEQIRNIYHLDLRPSRILLHNERPVLKIYNGGLWKVICECSPDGTAIRKLPLPFLPYRAPEQFRTYLARRRPPLFTDIYLFGVLFYEMLTGIVPFRATSFEEYEIQHCEQYPIPPKAWRPQIPDESEQPDHEMPRNGPLQTMAKYDRDFPAAREVLQRGSQTPAGRQVRGVPECVSRTAFPAVAAHCRNRFGATTYGGMERPTAAECVAFYITRNL